MKLSRQRRQRGQARRKANAQYILEWCKAGLFAQTKMIESSKRSALGVEMPEIDLKMENIAEWEDGELARRLGPMEPANGATGTSGTGHQPVVQFQMPQQPLSALDTAFLKGVTAGQNVSQTQVPSSSGYSQAQMVQLMGYMGLTSRERGQRPGNLD